MPSDTHALTSSERQVLDDAALGLTVIQTARKRSKGTETVKAQRKAILSKLQIRKNDATFFWWLVDNLKIPISERRTRTVSTASSTAFRRR